MYCTIDELVDRFGFDELVQLTDKERAGIIHQPTVDKAIEDASSVIDSFLQSRFTLPLSPIPIVLTQLCANIARYYLYDEAVSPAIEKRYDASMGMLKKINKGEVSLGVDTTNTPVQSDSEIIIESSGSVFSRENAKGFI